MNSFFCCIVVVGGGVVGWLIVLIIVVMYKYDDNVSVILVELLDVSILGVGEGMWFIMCSMFFKIGISEEIFLV